MADLNKLAARIVQKSTDPDDAERTPAQVNGSKGGKRGGRARAEKLTPEQRSEISRRAARARWEGHSKS